MKTLKTEHFGIQRKIVANMTSESWREIPHVSYMYEADVTELFALYKEMNSEYSTKITFNTLILKIITEGLKAAPEMNAHINFNRRLVRGQINTFENINISMPTILPNGKMMTVNLRNFESRDLDEMTAYINDVNRRAKNTNLDEALFSVSFNDTIKALKGGHILKTIYRLLGSKTGKHKVKTLSGKEKRAYEAIPETERLTAYDLEQGTVTVSNIGSTYLGQKGAMALLEIVPPQVCAFGVGAVQKKPVVAEGDKIEVRQILPICIAFDHRALDFGEIVPFMKKLDEIFENPEIIFSWRKDTRRLKRISA
ncbi:MAG: 2-oxo acid dehydrogenase subunit E2 [Clostridia bacterium]|nr:2-oxo acid dehydrogenase subunit E2 [Clostridia bacterium]